MRLSKGLRRAIDGGAVPPVRETTKGYKPKRRAPLPGNLKSGGKSGSLRQGIAKNLPWISMHMGR